jgi:hypothetical protein
MEPSHCAPVADVGGLAASSCVATGRTTSSPALERVNVIVWVGQNDAKKVPAVHGVGNISKAVWL